MADALSRLKEFLEKGCKVQKIQPPAFASDAETTLVMVTIVCPDGSNHIIKAYREEATELREYLRRSALQL
jgi:hypothetical protein